MYLEIDGKQNSDDERSIAAFLHIASNTYQFKNIFETVKIKIRLFYEQL